MTATPSDLPTIAVVLAGGTGSRVGLNIPKQLLKVAGRTIIEHTVAALHDCPEVDEIIVVMTPDFIDGAQKLLLGRSGWPKVSRVLAGGPDRNDSTRIALAAIEADEANVLFHDAVRPLVSRRVVSSCLEALGTYEAVDVAIGSADTIIRVDAEDRVVEIPDRSRLRRGQTPQGFRLSTIRRAYALAAADPDFRATDDCGVVLHYLPDVAIYVVAGDEQNMKVTYPVDLFIADKLFQLGSHLAAPSSEEDRRRALADKTVIVFGGSYGIGADVVKQAEAAGARVFSFSRSATQTYVEDFESVARAVQEVAWETGGIDAVVLSAAQLAKGRLSEMDGDEVRQQMEVNYLGPVNVARACGKHLRETGGHLVLFTSSSYTRGRAGYAMYSSTKAAVVNLAQALADEWSAEGVHVNVVNPERTRTPMRELAFGAEPDGTLLDSAVVAATVLDLLVSDATGHVVDVRQQKAASVVGPNGFGVLEEADAAVAEGELAGQSKDSVE